MQTVTSCFSCCACNVTTPAPSQAQEDVNALVTGLNQRALFTESIEGSWDALPQAKTSESNSVCVHRNIEGNVREHKVTIGSKTQVLPWTSEVTPGVATAPDIYSIFDRVVLVYPRGQFGMAAFKLDDGSPIAQLSGQGPSLSVGEEVRRLELGKVADELVLRVSVRTAQGERHIYARTEQL